MIKQALQQFLREFASNAGLRTPALLLCIFVASLFFASPLAAQVTVTTNSLPGGTVGTAYSQRLAATGGVAPYRWSVTAGGLPAGLNLNTNTGDITGTPTAVGTASFTVTAIDTVGLTGSKPLTIAIAAAPTITTPSLPGGTVGAAYSQTMAASGGTAPLTWSLSAGSLPAGIGPITGAGVIAGTPSSAGASNFTVRVTDGAGATATKALTITIAAPLTITTGALPGSTVGVAYSQTVAATGGTAPLTWSLEAGALPAGLGPITGAGVIAGTPSAAGTFNFTVRVADSVGAAATKAFTITIAAVPTITTASLPGGTVGTAYSHAMAATGGTAPLTWSLSAGALPAGFSPITGAGVIAGTPTAPAVGTTNFTVRVTDGVGAVATKALSITIAAAITITTPSLPGGTVGTAYSHTMAATGGTAPLTWSLSAGALPAGFSPITGAGVIAGTPSAAGTTNFTVRVTDGAGATATKALSIAIAAPLTITTVSLPGSTVGVTYSQTMAATGGTAPLTWSLSAGSLPTGLNPITGAGVIAGTPSAAGTFSFTVRVADSVGATATKALSIAVAAPLTITTPSLPGGTVGAAYSQTMASTGGTAPLTWSLSAGTLPAGIGPITGAGVIAGTPTAAALGTANFTVRVTDSVGAVATKALSITIGAALSITTSALPGGTIGAAYSQTLAATGGTVPLTWSLSAGPLPAGLSLTGGGVIAGTPTVAGPINFTVRVTDSLGATATKSLSITIAGAPSITTSALASGTAGTAYSQTVAASGGTAPLTFSLSAGSLPTGLNQITGGGVIAGTPTVAGPFNFTVRVTDSVGATATKAFTITIAEGLTITTSALPGSTVGAAYSQPLAATGGTAPLTWSLSAGDLPAGFSPITSGGVIAGTPTAAGTANFTARVTDSVGATTTKSLSITIAGALTITTNSFPGATVGAAYSQTAAATGGTAPLTWSLSAGDLPAGLNPITGAGVIDGTPSAAGTSNFTVKVTDSVGATTTKAFSIVVAGALSITTSALPGSTAGVAYSQTIAATGGTAPLTWSLSAGSLPAGLNPITGAGVIAGTPSAAGTANFTVRVTDSAGAVATKALSIVIAGALTITTTALPDGTIGTAYSQTPVATGGTAPLTWSLSAGSLPAGFSPITAAGVIAGTPSVGGTSNFTVRVTDSVGAVATKALSITVALPLSITTTALANGHVGSAYTATLVATGGTTPYTWAVPAEFGFLPAGLNLNAATGVISGTPTVVGLSNFVVQVSDNASPPRTKSQAFSITVAKALSIETTSLQGGNVASSYSQTVTVTGETLPLVWSITAGSLPAGLTLNTVTGQISGLPTAAGLKSFTLRVTDSTVPVPLTASRDLSINIDGAAGDGVLKITTSTLPSGTVGIQYSQSVGVAGGVLPYTLSVITGGMPPGLTLSPAGVLFGTPTESGTFGFTVRVTDSATTAQSDTKPVSITIIPSLSITTTSLPGVDVGVPYTATMTAAGGAQPYTWSVTGVLPGGLSLKADTGVISGTPTAAGTFNFRINVVDAVSRTSFKNFAIVVSFPPIDISIPATSQPAQQTPLALSLRSPYPTSLSGQLTLTFSPNAVVPNDDPMLQFSNGSRTVNFTIAANSTTAVFSPPVQLLTGTVAGTVRMGASFVNGPQDLTAGTTEIPAAAPQITAVEASLTSSTIVIRVTGYSVIRSVTSVTFGFDVRTASGIQRVNNSRNVDSDFGTWYQSPQSAAYGSLFVFSQTLNVQGDASTIEAVVVTLTNAKGSQTSLSTPLVRK